MKSKSNVEDTGDIYCSLDNDNNVITSAVQLVNYKNLKESDLVTINNNKPTIKGMISALLKKIKNFCYQRMKLRYLRGSFWPHYQAQGPAPQ